EGIKFNSPRLVILPLLVTEPIKSWLDSPPLKEAPSPMVNAPRIIQSTLGLIPPILLMLRLPYSGEEVELSTGGIDPLKFTVTATVEIALIRLSVCSTCPE